MRTLTLFAGAGGADIGLQRAGCQHVACVDNDPSAVATLLAAGFPGVHGWIGAPPDGSHVRPFDPYLYAGAVWLLWTSTPCQPYSNAGDRLGAADPRDGWAATLRAVHAIRPVWVIVENVGGAPINEWAADLGGLFARYRYPCVSYRTLDAADWGLPSHRVRQFLVAGPQPYRWPEPTHCGPDAPVTARLRLLPWVGFGGPLGLTDDHYLLPGNGGHLPAPRCATSPAHTVTASCPQYVLKRKPPEYAGLGRGASRPDLLSMPAAGVCTTEVKGTRASAASGFTFHGGPDRASDSLFLATGRRRLTWQECATLVGFPDDYPFQGTIEARYRQVGNAVAPIMAQVIAANLISQEEP